MFEIQITKTVPKVSPFTKFWLKGLKKGNCPPFFQEERKIYFSGFFVWPGISGACPFVFLVLEKIPMPG